ncbi:MAG: GNAT family N-acetyltransferase [Halieaceae bacterium]|nr:GNAT family N-acetyltransferase [Halieaceae bacterium]
MTPLTWQWLYFESLSNQQLYQILALRSEVFVVEQTCAYQDLDGKDLKALHLIGTLENKVLATARLLPAGVSYPDAASIGRIVVHPSLRGQDLGRKTVQLALTQYQKLWPDEQLLIGAQARLKRFYQELGFVAEGDVYDEDGIDHITMRWMNQ